MANPQRENGHIDIANEIAEALMRINLSAYESRVLWFIFRKTYGWNKKTDWLTLSQFSKSIGLDRRLIHRAIKHLSSKKMIVINKDDNNRISYGFQKNYRKWEVSSKKMIAVINRDDEVSSKEMTRVSSIEIPTNTTVTKDTTTNSSELEKSSSKPVIKIPLNDKNEYSITQKMINEWKELYPAINIMQTLRDIRGWNLSNPKKRKTKRGIMTHINTWLAKEQDKGGSIKLQQSKQHGEMEEL